MVFGIIPECRAASLRNEGSPESPIAAVNAFQETLYARVPVKRRNSLTNGQELRAGTGRARYVLLRSHVESRLAPWGVEMKSD